MALNEVNLCPVCDKEFTELVDLLDHLLNAHTTDTGSTDD